MFYLVVVGEKTSFQGNLAVRLDWMFVGVLGIDFPLQLGF